jgi:hypothetical protein
VLTESKLAAKRQKRTLASRRKAKARASRFGRQAELVARNREKTAAWLANLGEAQAKSQAAEERERQNRQHRVEVQRQHGKPGLMQKLRSFFGRGG